MKRASYREAVEYIALNDGPGDPEAEDQDTVMGLVTVGLVVAIFGVTHARAASDVIKIREREREAS